MVMVDVLCHMKEKALKEKNPHLFTIATLTGHAVLAVGPYSAVMDNGPARAEGFANKLQVKNFLLNRLLKQEQIR
jgi:leucyl aminopeptidase